MAEISGGHLAAKYLKEGEGVEAVFSLCGGHIDRILDGFLEYGIKNVDVRHEQAAAMAAHSWSIYKGKPGVCLVTAGPGFTNCLTGLVNAFQENAPVVFITGSAPVRDWQKGALQEIAQADMVKSSVKWQATCYDTARIPEYLSIAFRQAVSGRPGPVLLELPPDVLNKTTDMDKVIWPKSGSLVHRSAPEPALLKEAADLINRAERPVILGGSGVGASLCQKALKEFVAKTGAPFCLINTGRGTLPDDHPLSLWDGGLLSIITALSQADLVVALGVRFNWMLMFGQLFPMAKMVRVDIHAAEIDRNRPADVGLVGDVCLALEGLLPLVSKKDHSAWRAGLKEAYMPMVQGELDLRAKAADPIHPIRMTAVVREVVGDDALYIVDGGDTSYFAMVHLNAIERAGVLGAAGGQFGCLGTGLPFALAAKLAHPEKQVVVFNGDGSFGLNAMEFCTAVRHNLPFVCVINNDGAWGMIKHGQELCYGPDRVCSSELGFVHYEKIAEAFGGYGEMVEKEADLAPAIRRALASGKPACINVITDPSAVSLATLQFVDGFKME